MPDNTKYLFVALPSSITPSGHKDDAIGAIQRAVKSENGLASQFSIPDFKVGTLDALIQQSDDLGRIEGLCKGVVSKVGDTLRNVLEGDEGKIVMHKNVNDNSDVRTKYNQYNTLRTQSQNLQRRQTGNLSTKSLVSIVSPDMLISDSEHLETHLIAVPNSSVKDFHKSYETVSQMVVPRSAYFIQKDEEFNLFAVSVFKKHAQDFVHKCREKKWIPRDFKFKEGGREEEQKEIRKTEAEEKRVWGETLRLGRTGWSEGMICLVHVIVLRCFVESVLRYGLPPDYATAMVKSDTKKATRAKQGLDAEFGYLAGNAFGRDKKGKISKDQGISQNDVMGGGGGDTADYCAYVYYEIEME
ncbi:Vacuolar ATP synthase subunit C [Exophiala xenobiotica]|nr:Vacuolar ATP synthase subunit C [Exophiala xenobiotica]